MLCSGALGNSKFANQFPGCITKPSRTSGNFKGVTFRSEGVAISSQPIAVLQQPYQQRIPRPGEEGFVSLTLESDGSLRLYVNEQWAVKMKKPVVSTEWVEKCWAEHAALPEEKYRLPVFVGLKICCTSLKGTAEPQSSAYLCSYMLIITGYHLRADIWRV